MMCIYFACARKRIMLYLISKVNTGCACRILFLLSSITVFGMKNAFADRESHHTPKIDLQNKIFPKSTPGRASRSRNGGVNFAYTFVRFCGILGVRKAPARLFTKAVVLLNTLSGVFDVFHQIAGLAIQ